MPKISQNQETYHFYLPNGKSCHGTIEEGRAAGALPSVTTVLSLIRKEFVEKHKIREGIAASLLLPKQEGESLKDYAERCINHTQRIQSLTTDFGTRIHASIENFHLQHILHQEGKTPNPPTAESSCKERPETLPWIEHYVKWFHKHVERVIHAEQISVCIPQGYAGQIDAYVILKTKETAIIDFKTQKLKEKIPQKSPKNPPQIPPEKKPSQYWQANFYKTWLLQLAAYQNAIRETSGTQPKKLVSVVINSQEPEPIQHKIWKEEEYQPALEAFIHNLQLWKWLHNFH